MWTGSTGVLPRSNVEMAGERDVTVFIHFHILFLGVASVKESYRFNNDTPDDPPPSTAPVSLICLHTHFISI